MSYPPGVTQWHIDYYAGGYDEPCEEEEEDITDYWQAIYNIEWHNIVHGGTYPRAVRELG